MFNFYFFNRYEIDVYGFCVEFSIEERDLFGYFKCRVNCGYVFSIKVIRNRFIVLLLIGLRVIKGKIIILVLLFVII